MRPCCIGAVAAGVWALAMASPALSAAPTAVGLWEKLDQSGKPAAWFRILDCNGMFIGRIVRIFPQPGENPSDWRCTQCKGEQKNAPVLGIAFIKGMRRDGMSYRDGTILDPRDGTVYSALMELSGDGQKLTVRGYIGLPFLGQSEMWQRLRENGQPQRFNSCPQA